MFIPLETMREPESISSVCWFFTGLLIKRNIFPSFVGSLWFSTVQSMLFLVKSPIHRIGWWDNLQGTPKPIFDYKKTWVSCRFFLKQIHWPVVSSTNSIFAGPGPVGPRSQGSRHSTCSAQDDGVQRLCVGDDGRNAWTVMDDWWTVTGWSFLFFPWMVIQDQSIWSSHIIIPIIYMISQ